MPIDYSKYPPNWKSEIRPAILKRADNRCEFCGVANYKEVIRGEWFGVECYQCTDGYIYDAKNSKVIDQTYLGEVHPTNKLIKVVLTIAHIDHDIKNNSFWNLKALCQRCHNRHDVVHRKKNKGTLELF